MNTEPPYAGLKWGHYFRVMLLVPLDQGTQGNKGRKGISLPKRPKRKLFSDALNRRCNVSVFEKLHFAPSTRERENGFRHHSLWRAFSKSFIFCDRKGCLRVDASPKHGKDEEMSSYHIISYIIIYTRNKSLQLN